MQARLGISGPHSSLRMACKVARGFLTCASSENCQFKAVWLVVGEGYMSAVCGRLRRNSKIMSSQVFRANEFLGDVQSPCFSLPALEPILQPCASAPGGAILSSSHLPS